MSDKVKRTESDVIVRFSEVHWFEVTVPKARLEAAATGRDSAGISGPSSGYPEDVAELLTALAIDQPGALKEVDGQEIHSIRPA